MEGFSQYPNDSVAPPFMGAPLPSVFEEDCISSVPSYMALNPSSPCTYLSPGMPPYMPHGPLTTALSTDSSGIFGGNIGHADILKAISRMGYNQNYKKKCNFNYSIWVDSII